MDGFNYDMNQYQGTPPPDAPIYGAFDLGAGQLPGTLPPGQYFGDVGDGIDENDPKRRRIARVCTQHELDLDVC